MGVVETARSYIGKVTYKFGADDVPGGVADCSSFTQYVFGENGYSIGRDTESQWTGAGERIDREDIQPGDLVFFKNTYLNDHTDNVSHVGIYSGDGKFIHCSSSKGVTESAISQSYYANHYLGAKRIEGANSGETDSFIKSRFGDSVGVKWWGDIVTVAICALLLIGGVVMIVLSVKDNFK